MEPIFSIYLNFGHLSSFKDEYYTLLKYYNLSIPYSNTYFNPFYFLQLSQERLLLCYVYMTELNVPELSVAYPLAKQMPTAKPCARRVNTNWVPLVREDWMLASELLLLKMHLHLFVRLT